MKTVATTTQRWSWSFYALCLLFILWACENEDPLTPNPQLEKLNAIATQFNPAHFKKSIPFDFEVSWTPQHARYSEDLQSMYYEFPIEYTSAFNPDALAKTEEGGSKYTLRYSVLVTEKAPDEFRFYVGRYYEEGAHDALKNGKLFENTSEYTGFVHVLNTKGKLVFAKRIQDGVEDPKKWVAEEFASTSNQQRMVEDCVIITTYHYIDWYNVDPQGNYYYIKSTLEDTSLTQVCHSYWLPDLVRTGGGGASGPYVGVGEGGAYQDCGGTTQRYVEEGTCTYNITPQVKECEEGYVLNDEGECVEEEQIINELTGKAKCLNDYLDQQDNSFIKNILRNFEGDSEFDIRISSEEKVFKQDLNIEVNGVTRHERGSSEIQIKISTSKLLTMPALGAARTLIHEYIHAEMYRKLYTKYPSEGDLSFKLTYESYENERLHNAMAELYVNSMKETLINFHRTVLVGDYNYLTNNGANPLPDAFYEALAWQGLKEHSVQAYLDLPESKKAELANNLILYYHSTTKNCPE